MEGINDHPAEYIRTTGFYAHMCRMDHTEIGHNDSSSEMCPLCRLKVENERLRLALAQISEWTGYPETAEIANEALSGGRKEEKNG